MFLGGADEGCGRAALASDEHVENGCRAVIMVTINGTYHEYGSKVKGREESLQIYWLVLNAKMSLIEM